MTTCSICAIVYVTVAECQMKLSISLSMNDLTSGFAKINLIFNAQLVFDFLFFFIRCNVVDTRNSHLAGT